MKNKSTKFKFRSIISVLLCLVLAILVWLLVGYAESALPDSTAENASAVYGEVV